MKSIMTMLILALTLLTVSIGYAAPAQNLPVRVDGQGITFPDNTLQTSAAILPVCQPGEVYVKANTGMLCAKVKLIPNGIATCIDKVCTVSSCIDGIGNCDGLNPNVCGTNLQTSATNCGACGTVCTSQNECATPVCVNGLCGGTSNKPTGTTCSTGICNGGGTCVPIPVCGNGKVEIGEQCDDGNVTNGDGCSATCQIENGYQCSGVNPSVCKVPVCGDGVVDIGEQCDDGNTTNGDGCSNTCQIELGFSCAGTKSVCSAICGDGLIRGAEQCDDSNTTNGDGCSSTCQIESVYMCTGEPSVCVIDGCKSNPCTPAPGPTCSNGTLTMTNLVCTPQGGTSRICSYPSFNATCASNQCNGNVCKP